MDNREREEAFFEKHPYLRFYYAIVDNLPVEAHGDTRTLRSHPTLKPLLPNVGVAADPIREHCHRIFKLAPKDRYETIDAIISALQDAHQAVGSVLRCEKIEEILGVSEIVDHGRYSGWSTAPTYQDLVYIFSLSSWQIFITAQVMRYSLEGSRKPSADAARLVGLSPSEVAKLLTKVEQRLGEQLFEKVGGKRGHKLTTLGHLASPRFSKLAIALADFANFVDLSTLMRDSHRDRRKAFGLSEKTARLLAARRSSKPIDTTRDGD